MGEWRVFWKNLWEQNKENYKLGAFDRIKRTINIVFESLWLFQTRKMFSVSLDLIQFQFFIYVFRKLTHDNFIQYEITQFHEKIVYNIKIISSPTEHWIWKHIFSIWRFPYLDGSWKVLPNYLKIILPLKSILKLFEP